MEAEEARKKGLVKTEVKPVSAKKAKELTKPEKPKRQMSEKQMENWKKVMEANRLKREQKAEEELRAIEEHKKKLEEEVATGKKVKIPIKKKEPKPAKVVQPPSDNEELSESEDEEEVITRVKPKPKPKPVKTSKVWSDDETELSELPSDVDLPKEKTKIVVPRPVKSKIQAIKQINNTIREVEEDPHGYLGLIRKKWA